MDAVFSTSPKLLTLFLMKDLLGKLSSLSIKGNLLKWIRSYLSNRSKIVVVDGMMSKSKPMLSVVP